MSAADGEAVLSVVSFSPPAVENRTVQSAVENDFLTAGSGGFQRTARIVQPDVNSLNEMPPEIDVVIFEENNFPPKFLLLSQLVNFLQNGFALIVGG